MTDGNNGGSSRLERLRQKHKALLSTSSRKIAQSRSRLDWYSDEFEGSGRKFYFQENGKKGEPITATVEGTAEEEGSKPDTEKAQHRRSSTGRRLMEENTKLKEKVKEIQAEREMLRKNLSQVAVQVQNASKAILSTKVHEANAKLSAMEIDLKETQERLEAKESSQSELLTQMQKLRKENAKLGSQARLNSHAMSGTKDNKIKKLQERITDLEETNRDLTLDKAKIDAQLRIEQEDDYEGMTKVKQKGSKNGKKENKDLENIRKSNMTMMQTQLAVSAAQLTAAEMELADKEFKIGQLMRALGETNADNKRLSKAKEVMVDAGKIDDLEKVVNDLESTNYQLIQEKMRMSMASITEDTLVVEEPGAAVLSPTQLTAVEMELAYKEFEIGQLKRALEEIQTDNNLLNKAKEEMVDVSKIDELEKVVNDLQSTNHQLIHEKMRMSMASITEDTLIVEEPVAAAAPLPSSTRKTQKRVRDSNLTMMQTKLAVSNAQLSSLEQDMAEKEHELMDTHLRLDEANKQLEHALRSKEEVEKKLQDEITKAYKLKKKNEQMANMYSQDPVPQVPTNIALGVGNGEIGGTFDFGAGIPGDQEASVKVIHFGGDDETARSAMTGYTEASSMAQTYAATIVQTKLADSYAKYADLELKYGELKSTLDSAMVEIGTKQSASDTQAIGLSEARDKNATMQANMADLQAQIAVLEDKQLKGLKRQMRKSRRAEEEGEGDDEEEEEEVMTVREHRSTVAILNTKLQEANVRISSLEREMDELADMLESTLIDGEGKRAIINSLNLEIVETRKENADLFTQVQEFEAMTDVFEGARILELETKMMGLEMINQQLMLQQLEDEDAANSAFPFSVDDPDDDNEEADHRGSKVEKLERKIRGLERMNTVLSSRNLIMGGSSTYAPITEAGSDDHSSSSSSSSSS